MKNCAFHSRLSMEDLSIFDLKNRFYAKTTPIGDLQTTGITDLDQYCERFVVVKAKCLYGILI